jgi:hypothetical protein
MADAQAKKLTGSEIIGMKKRCGDQAVRLSNAAQESPSVRSRLSNVICCFFSV